MVHHFVSAFRVVCGFQPERRSTQTKECPTDRKAYDPHNAGEVTSVNAGKAQSAGQESGAAKPRSTKRAPEASQKLLNLVLKSLDADKAEDIVCHRSHEQEPDGRLHGHRQRTFEPSRLSDRRASDRERRRSTAISGRAEGLPQGDWVLVDAIDVIVHVFRPEVRAFYNLEKMWGDGGVDRRGRLARLGPHHRHPGRRTREGRAGDGAREAISPARATRAACSASRRSRSTEFDERKPEKIDRDLLGGAACRRARRARQIDLQRRFRRANSRAGATRANARAVLIGGPDGLPAAVEEAARVTLSFGTQTWPHLSRAHDARRAALSRRHDSGRASVSSSLIRRHCHAADC